MRLRILIVDDHHMPREAVKTALRFCRTIADELGVTKGTIQRWHKGISYPSTAKAMLLIMNGQKNKRPPKLNRYRGTNYLQRRANGEVQSDSGRCLLVAKLWLP